MLVKHIEDVNMKEEKKIRISFQLPESLYKAFQSLAEEQDRTASSLLRVIIAKAVENGRV
jgi:predicted DNA-binding protein